MREWGRNPVRETENKVPASKHEGLKVAGEIGARWRSERESFAKVYMQFLFFTWTMVISLTVACLIFRNALATMATNFNETFVWVSVFSTSETWLQKSLKNVGGGVRLSVRITFMAIVWRQTFWNCTVVHKNTFRICPQWKVHSYAKF